MNTIVITGVTEYAISFTLKTLRQYHTGPDSGMEFAVQRQSVTMINHSTDFSSWTPCVDPFGPYYWALYNKSLNQIHPS